VKAGGSCLAHATGAGVSNKDMAMAGEVFPELAAACIIALGSCQEVLDWGFVNLGWAPFSTGL
jgi:hypothetical protein